MKCPNPLPKILSWGYPTHLRPFSTLNSRTPLYKNKWSFRLTSIQPNNKHHGEAVSFPSKLQIEAVSIFSKHQLEALSPQAKMIFYICLSQTKESFWTGLNSWTELRFLSVWPQNKGKFLRPLMCRSIGIILKLILRPQNKCLEEINDI